MARGLRRWRETGHPACQLMRVNENQIHRTIKPQYASTSMIIFMAHGDCRHCFHSDRKIIHRPGMNARGMRIVFDAAIYSCSRGRPA
jgi:hypothetical protein